MEEHNLWIAVEANRLLGPLVAPFKNSICTAIYSLFGHKYLPPEKVIPDHVLFALFVFLFCCVFFPLVRRTFSMENPGKSASPGSGNRIPPRATEENIGMGKILPMIATIGTFICS
jgi:hypothetical protein